MKPEIKQRWVAALRSGRYTQTEWFLRNRNEGGKIVGHCCLGVLCDLHSKETGEKWGSADTYLGTLSHVPKQVQEWAGINTENPELTFDGTTETASVWNDGQEDEKGKRGRKKTFREIADAIEAQL